MRLRLIGKYTLAIGIVVLATMALFAYLNLHTLRSHLLEEAVRDVDFLSETIIQTTHYQMLEDDRKRVYKMIEEVGTQEGIEHIRLINKDGIINFSTEAAEIGTTLDKKAEACTVCHAANTPLVNASSMNRSRFFKDVHGRDVLGIARGIYNEPVCSSADCHFHAEDVKLLGVLDVIVSLDRAQKNLNEHAGNVALLTLCLLLLMAMVLTLLTQSLIDEPVQRLLRHTEQVAKGDFSTRIEVVSEDELGQLASSFNRMTIKLEEAHCDLNELMHNLEAMVEERSRKLQEIQSRLLQSEKLASIGELAAGIAHEINNPLTGIVMFASMVLNHKDLSPELRGDLQTVLNETQRCADIVRRLLEFSRSTPPHKEPDKIARLLDHTLALVMYQAAFHDVHIIKSYREGLPEIMLDPNQIQQVFMNLLLNASQSMPDGGVLELSADLEGEWVIARVRDTGCGVSPENLKKIFDPFFTTKGSSGTGLGLSISYGIIHNHGGTIEVESTVGKGTVFTIRLPAGEKREVVNPEWKLGASAGG
ncbi:MAG TPA: ATP-binding protein [Desulfuromonadales bacterium]|nr:ATP-binding protein [Desulfuromonadales bacterium]